MLLVSFLREGRRKRIVEEAGVGLGFVFQHLLSDWESSQGLDTSLSGFSGRGTPTQTALSPLCLCLCCCRGL